MIALLAGLLWVALGPAGEAPSYPVDLRVTATTAGVRLRLTVKDTRPASRGIVRAFTVVHDRPMDLFVIGADLAFFAHEHPVQQPDGVFIVDVALPKPGPYMAIAEFLPEGGTPQTFQQMFTTGEAFAAPVMPAIDTAPKTIDGVRVSADVSQALAGAARPLVFRLDDVSTGTAQPFLGTSAQLVLVPVDLTEAFHGYAADDTRDGGLTFTPLVPRPGRYKVWIQFERGGRVTTASFVFESRIL